MNFLGFSCFWVQTDRVFYHRIHFLGQSEFLLKFCMFSLFQNPRMSGQKRPADSGGPSSSGGPPEKRREKEGEEGGAGVSSAAGGSTAVETVIKLGGVSNSVRPFQSSPIS